MIFCILPEKNPDVHDDKNAMRGMSLPDAAGWVAAFSGLVRRAPSYLREDAKSDALAGMTVAVMGVPQAMAYAMIAGLPPIYGIYTCITPCFIAALFGSSRHLVTGPSNATSMVILSLTAGLGSRHGVDHLQVVLALTLLAGLMQLGFGLLKAGRVVRYVSNSVVVGFTAGAGILIVANQLGTLLDVQPPPGTGHQFIPALWGTLHELPETNPYALAVGLATVLAILGCRRISKRLPASLIAVVAVSLLAGAAGWLHVSMGEDRVEIVRDIQVIVPSLDLFGIPQLVAQPDWALWRDLLGGALALAVFGLVESTSIARGIAISSGQRLDFNREFVGQGLAKILGSFAHSFASSGSLARSAALYQSGGRTRLAAASSAVFTALILLVFGSWANYVPQAVLAGLIMVTAFTMIDRKHLAMTWRSGKNSRIVLGGTLAATLLLPLEMAVFAGVILSVVILLRVTGRTDLTQLVHHPDYGFEEVPFNRAAPAPVAIINLEGDLYFAAAEDLDYELLQALRPETRVVVLRLKRLRAVGSSAMAMLEHFHELLEKRGIELILCGVENDIKKVMTGSGLRRTIGEQNIFYADNRIFQSTELAIARAMSIVEMRRAASDKLAESVQEQTLTATNVADVMQKRCLRFGNEHQLREAMWLISQFQQRMKTDYPQTVFLQDRDGRLSAALSQALVLRDLAGAVPEEEAASLDDRALAVLLETRLYRPVSDVAPKDAVTLPPGEPLAGAFARAARHGFRPMPVCDEHGRIAGVFDEVAMLRGLTRFLEARHMEMRGQPAGKPASS